MGKKRWTDAEQLKWFEAKKPEYVEQHAQDGLGEWWDPVFQEFLDKWPLDEPSEAEVRTARGNVQKAKDTKNKKAKVVSTPSSRI